MKKSEYLRKATEKFIYEICNELGLNSETVEKAKFLIEITVDEIVIKSRPNSLAAAAVYFSALMNNERRSQREIAKAAKVTQQTVGVIFRRIIKDQSRK